MEPGLTPFFNWILPSLEDAERKKYFLSEILSPLLCTVSRLSKAVARLWSSSFDNCVHER